MLDMMSANEEKARTRLYNLLDLQKETELKFRITGYNVFVFGSYITTRYVEGKSDIDIAIYSEDFDVYLKISTFLEEKFNDKGIKSDIFYIEISMQAPIYCAALKSKVQFTDYYPEKLVEFYKACQIKLDENKKVKLKE